MTEELTIKQQVENSKYVYIGFNPAGEEIQDNTPKDPLVLSVSNDAINWTKIKEYSDIYLRDADMVKIDGYYWIIGTLKLFRTVDFVNFDSYSLSDTLNTASNGKYHNIWAPEFVRDHTDNSWHIVYSANDSNRGIYFADFNPSTGEITNCFQECDVDCQNSIDPNINYID
ncbi:hypothetical protein ACKI2C_47105, partial [Streptomyces brasiliscabiei]|uniref:hypothetical protein n=1 Tax=Streptomyces brasiliscabiei TaxID=2736302 RepID=UPI0038F74F5F